MRNPGRVRGDAGALSTVDPTLPNLARDKGNFFTRAAAAADVYGELVKTDDAGVRWRRWDPHRSKFAALLHEGGLSDGLGVLLHSSSLLYLGAASGTTTSHIADIVAPRNLYAVEFAARSFQDLIERLRPWPNVLPVMADARQPQTYRAMVGGAGGIVQDVAQPGQVAILRKNAQLFLQEGAMVLLFLKARSEDSAAEPSTVYANARRDLDRGGFRWVRERSLDAFEKDHRAFLARWDG